MSEPIWSKILINSPFSEINHVCNKDFLTSMKIHFDELQFELFSWEFMSHPDSDRFRTLLDVVREHKKKGQNIINLFSRSNKTPPPTPLDSSSTLDEDEKVIQPPERTFLKPLYKIQPPWEELLKTNQEEKWKPLTFKKEEEFEKEPEVCNGSEDVDMEIASEEDWEAKSYREISFDIEKLIE